MNRQALGKGLSALIPEVSDQEAAGVRELAIEEIAPNPEQPRTRFEEAKLDELAASLRVHGVVQPVVVRTLPDGKYGLIVGERRVRAARRAGLTAVPAIVRDVEEAEALEIALVENLQRVDLNPIDEAQGYEALMEMGGLSQADVAERVGKDRSTVANAVRLLELDGEVQEMLAAGSLTAGHGRALLGLGDATSQKGMAERAFKDRLSVRQVEALVRGRRRKKKEPRRRRSDDPVVREWEERLQRIFGTLVRIERMGNEGSVRIEYYSDEDLERVLELLSSLERGAAG